MADDHSQSQITLDSTGRSLCAAWGQHLARFQWSFLLTLTCKHGTSRDRLVREFKRLIKRLERIGRCRISWFFALERATSGDYHVHALVHVPVFIPRVLIESNWRMGLAQARTYDNALAGTHYVVKTLRLDQSADDYDLSVEMPPPRQFERDGQSAAA